MIIKKCDRCERDITNEVDAITMTISGELGSFVYDLCPWCGMVVWKFAAGKPVTVGLESHERIGKGGILRG